MEKEFLLMTFSSTHSAMAMERLLEKTFDIMVMPVLREISSSCGIAIKVSITDFQAIQQVINENKFESERYSVYKIIDKEGNREVIALKAGVL